MVGRKASLADEGSYLRKLRKPMIEKRRRDRMNTSIDTLKKIVTKSRPELDSDTKLDKADILELTVNHLRKEQQQQQQSVTSESYTQGFGDCSRETIQYLVTSGILDSVSLSRLTTHLQSVCMTGTTCPTTARVSMETRRPSQPRFCSTPQSRFLPVFSRNASLDTSPSTSLSYSSSFNSISDDSYSVSAGSDTSFLGNISTDVKLWRPW